jgi:ppGpp synthetase/RelA/SpoT-type nucleotidyltranferase
MHAWAAIDHQLSYKKEELPPRLQRRLYGLSAIMEEADNIFDEIKHQSSKKTK